MERRGRRDLRNRAACFALAGGHYLRCAIGAWLFGMSACVAVPPKLRMPEASPWRVPPAEIASQLGTICIFPAAAVDERLDGRAQRLSELAEVELRRAGYPTVRLEKGERRSLYKQALENVGGVMGPATGWRDIDRVRAVQKRLRELARDRHHCDSFLDVQVVAVRAPMHDGIAKWDGKEVQVLDYLSGVATAGWVGALSLHARISDVGNRELYFFTGAIEPVVTATSSWSPLEPPLQAASTEQLLTAEEHLITAVSAALEPLRTLRR